MCLERAANSLAHIIATETLKRGEEIYLVNAAPPFATDCLAANS